MNLPPGRTVLAEILGGLVFIFAALSVPTPDAVAAGRGHRFVGGVVSLRAARDWVVGGCPHIMNAASAKPEL